MSSITGHFLRESPVRRQIASLAADQHGIVTANDLRALGVHRRTVSRWIESGYLHRVQPRAYAVGHPGISIRGQWFAAVHSFRGLAALSHWSAAQLWGLSPPALPSEVTVPRHTGTVRRQVRCHQKADLSPAETTVHNRIPVTTVARTLFDLASSVPVLAGDSLDAVERVASTAWRARMLDLGQLHDLLERSSGRRGVRRFKALLMRLDPEILATRSGGERILVQLLRDAGLGGFGVNRPIGAIEVDIVWREEGLVLEFDGAAYHSDSEAFERDRRRDAYLKRRGYEVIRVTYRMAVESPEETVATVREVLERRRRR